MFDVSKDDNGQLVINGTVILYFDLLGSFDYFRRPNRLWDVIYDIVTKHYDITDGYYGDQVEILGINSAINPLLPMAMEITINMERISPLPIITCMDPVEEVYEKLIYINERIRIASLNIFRIDIGWGLILEKKNATIYFNDKKLDHVNSVYVSIRDKLLRSNINIYTRHRGYIEIDGYNITDLPVINYYMSQTMMVRSIDAFIDYIERIKNEI